MADLPDRLELSRTEWLYIVKEEDDGKRTRNSSAQEGDEEAVKQFRKGLSSISG